MTLMNTVMFGPIKKEVNGSHYNVQRDGDGSHIPNTPFSGKKGLAEELCQNVLLKNSDCTHKRQKGLLSTKRLELEARARAIEHDTRARAERK